MDLSDELSNKLSILQLERNAIATPVLRSLNPQGCTFHALLGQALLGEAPFWIADRQELLWVDILSCKAHFFHLPSRQQKSCILPEAVSAMVPRSGGGYIALSQTAFCAVDTLCSRLSSIAAPEKLCAPRFNDGKCDAAGRFLAGTLGTKSDGNNSLLYGLNTDLQLSCILPDLSIANGIGWNVDSSTMYLVDSGRRLIYALDYNLHSGAVANKRVFADFAHYAKGTPDGLAVDIQGGVWCAVWDGGCVVHYTADGKLDLVVSLPVPRPTSCAFGGKDLRTLFITSARTGLTEAELAAAPQSGNVFSLELDIPGVPVSGFLG